MKKIGILTYQFADNYGAVLQSYALCRAINQFEDCRANVINYIPPEFRYMTHRGYAQVLFLQKRKLFDSFLMNYCNVEEEIKNTIDYKEYDYICVGSDQVWSTSHKEYFLPKAENVKKITYAASLGYLPDSKRLDENLLKVNVPKFDNISIREDIHRKYIYEICAVETEVVLDPTLLFDKDIYLPIVKESKKEDEGFVFLFYLPHDDETFKAVEIANKIARKYNISIIHSILDASDNMFAGKSRCMMYEGVEDFLYYIKNARFVITNSYHATIFAMQFETPFYTLVVESMRSRIDTLAEKLGIESRIVEQGLLDIDISDSIDWRKIKEQIMTERQKSYKYLRKALDVND